jgi:PAS domain S-box-containing protein
MFRMLGYDPATASGKPEFFLDLAHPDDRARLQELVRQVPDSSVDRVETECRLRAADGTWHWILCRGVCAERGTDGKPVRVVGTHSDCTNLRLLEDRHLRLEDQLFQQQRLECIEAIAGGVAHEINDPINGIMNDAELISDRLGPDCETARFAQGIVRETQRVAPIIGDLLAFARAEPESPEPVRVQDMVNSALALTGTLLRHHQVMVEVNIPADLPDLTCRRRQILQVLINLVLNSTDALDARFPSADPRKRLGIRTEVFEEEGHTWLSLIVEDSGCGIPPAVRERIFEPFYTSGTDGHRTGLGLAVSLDIVRRHKGRIRVESQEGESTSFAVDLPLAAAPVCAWTE